MRFVELERAWSVQHAEHTTLRFALWDVWEQTCVANREIWDGAVLQRTRHDRKWVEWLVFVMHTMSRE